VNNIIAFEPESMDDMVTVSSELIEQAELAMKLEALVADIKATTYSPFSNDWIKIKFIKKAIQEAGF
jgi:hypothetical protein